MIIGNTAKIGIGRNLKYLLEKGYDLPMQKDSRGRITTGRGKVIEIKIDDLPPKSGALVKIKCEDCGKEKEVAYYSLFQNKNGYYQKTGETPCSKCILSKRWKGKKNPQYIHGNNNYCFYRFGAKRRGYSFNLSIKQFEKLTSQKCFYCGDTGGGIDRKINSIGYEIKNCVPCCKTCNFLKHGMDIKDFLKLIKKIYEIQK